MEIRKVANFLNLTIMLMIVFALSIPVMLLTINFKLDAMTPNKFVAVTIEGEPTLKPVIVQSTPILNTESVKDWVKTTVNYFMNYTSTDYIEKINGGARYMTPRYYPAFRKQFINKAEQDWKNGYQISSSVVIEDPVLIGKADINGIPYYQYYLKTSTEYKAETRTIPRVHDVIISVKKEKPSEFLRGVAIDDLKIK